MCWGNFNNVMHVHCNDINVHGNVLINHETTLSCNEAFKLWHRFQKSNLRIRVILTLLFHVKVLGKGLLC